MGAIEVLRRVGALPARERREFFARIDALEPERKQRLATSRRCRIRWPDAAARRHRIFGDKFLPNLVLLARDGDRY